MLRGEHLPRRNRNADSPSGFEAMSGSKIKALTESLAYEWRLRTGREAPSPAPRERW